MPYHQVQFMIFNSGNVAVSVDSTTVVCSVPRCLNMNLEKNRNLLSYNSIYGRTSYRYIITRIFFKYFFFIWKI